VSLGYPSGIEVFRDFSLTIDDTTVLVGPTGAGKSTLLASLIGLIPPKAGRIRVAGAWVTPHADDARRRVSYLPQANWLPRDLTVREYLYELGRLDGLSAALAGRRAEEMAARVHLEHVLSRRLRHLSGGMQRRALLAGALLKPAEWLLVDQPTAGLDPEEQLTVLTLLQEERRRRGVLMVTPLIEEAWALPDRLVILDAGRTVATTSWAELAESAEGHVFAMRDASPGDAYALWKPLPDGTGIKILADTPPPEAEVLAPTAEDGYFWLLITRGGDR
jgi:ABC-2 type transport system ATP-binding protein